jgi:hypothetical protein
MTAPATSNPFVAATFMTVAVFAIFAASPSAAVEHRLAGYEPMTPISNYATLDLDMEVMSQMVDFGLVDLARTMYEHGGHSQSVSNLTLVNATPPHTTIPAGTKVIGRSMDGELIQGTIVIPMMWQEGTEKVILPVEYDTILSNQTSFCRLGGLAPAGTADIKGCFKYGGDIQILDFSTEHAPVYRYKYGYEPYLSTYNIATFKQLSTSLAMPAGTTNNGGGAISSRSGHDTGGGHDGTSHYKPTNHDSKDSNSNTTTINSNNNNVDGGGEKTYQSTLVLGEHFAKYTSYYKTPRYADEFIQAALLARPTNFLHGNADFSKFRPRSRIEVLRVATKTLHVWMYVVQQLESALELCSQPCDEEYGSRCDDYPVRAWDQSFAYYAGSLEGEHGEGEGKMLFDLADNMCHKTNTCTVSGIANINIDIVNLFTAGQLAVLQRRCADAYDIKEKIVSAMTVPLVQAVMHEAYYQHTEISGTDDIMKVQRASYAAALLPLVHHCNPNDAEKIYFSMGLGIFDDETAVNYTTTTKNESTLNFQLIKQALEDNYGCLGVTCRSVGGVWNGTNYGTGASPCTFNDDPRLSSARNEHLIKVLTVTLLGSLFALIVTLVGVVIVRRGTFGIGRKYKKHNSDGDGGGEKDGIHRDVEENNNNIDDWESHLTTVPLD